MLVDDVVPKPCRVIIELKRDLNMRRFSSIGMPRRAGSVRCAIVELCSRFLHSAYLLGGTGGTPAEYETILFYLW